MSDRDLPPWSDELQSLLAAERRTASPSAASAAARARIFQHVEGILGPAIDLPPVGPHAPGHPAPPSQPHAQQPGTQLPPAAPLAQSVVKAVGAKAAAGKMLALAFTAGALAGVGGYAGAQRLLARPAAPIAAPVSAAPAQTAAPVAGEPPITQRAVTPIVTAPTKAHDAKPAPANMHAPRADAEERTLVETARTALQRGDAAGALAILDRLRKEHAKSEFGEEAQALRVMSLAGMGRAGEARQEAAAFHRRYPESLLGQAVDASVSGLPVE